MGRHNHPRAQTAMYLWGKPSQFGCTLLKMISYLPHKSSVNVANVEKCDLFFLPFLLFWIFFLIKPHSFPTSLMVAVVTRAVQKWMVPGVPGWLSWLSIGLHLRSWFHSSRGWAPHQAPCWQLSLEPALDSVSPSLSAPPLLMLALSLSQKNNKKH